MTTIGIRTHRTHAARRLAFALLAAALVWAAGCATTRRDLPPAFQQGSGGAKGTQGGDAQPSLTVVPDVVGTPIGDAEETIRGAGLEPVARDVHGPIEPEASGHGPGVVYKQVPAAGAKVAPGGKVELSSWWESQ